MISKRFYACAIAGFALCALYFLVSLQLCGWRVGAGLSWINWIREWAKARQAMTVVEALDATQIFFGFCALSVAYAALVFVAGRAAPIGPRSIFGLAAFVCTALVLSGRLQSTDIFDYLVRGRILAVHHQNPFLVPPQAIHNDPYLKLCHWPKIVWSYGPIWLLLVSAATAMPSPLGAALVIRAMMAMAHVANGWMIWTIHADAIPKKRARLTALYLFCPLALWEFAANGHCDAIAITFILLGFLLDQRGRRAGAAAALMAAAMIKIYTGPILLFYFLANVRKGSLTVRRSAAVEILWPAALLTLIFYVPFVHTRAAIFAPFGGGGVNTVNWSWGEIPFIRHWIPSWLIVTLGLRITLLAIFGGCVEAWSHGDWREAGAWFLFLWSALGATWFEPWYPTMALATGLVAGRFRLRFSTVFLAMTAPASYFIGCVSYPEWVPTVAEALTPWATVLPVLVCLALALRAFSENPPSA